jgi:hypothetical protein
MTQPQSLCESISLILLPSSSADRLEGSGAPKTEIARVIISIGVFVRL